MLDDVAAEDSTDSEGANKIAAVSLDDSADQSGGGAGGMAQPGQPQVVYAQPVGMGQPVRAQPMMGQPMADEDAAALAQLFAASRLNAAQSEQYAKTCGEEGFDVGQVRAMSEAELVRDLTMKTGHARKVHKHCTGGNRSPGAAAAVTTGAMAMGPPPGAPPGGV